MLREIRDLSHARRWGVARQIHPQSVAEHSYYVTIYAGEIALILGYPDYYVGELLRYCLWHDASEQFTTDIPGPVKRAVCDETKLKEYEHTGMRQRFGNNVPLTPPNSYAKVIAKLADMVDEVCHLLGEQRLGNTNMRRLLPCSQDRLQKSLLAVRRYTTGERFNKLSEWVADVLVSEENGDSLEPQYWENMQAQALR